MRIKYIEQRLAVIQSREPTLENLECEASLCLELNEWREREEIKWNKKSRELWLKHGDRNSKFFHLSTIVRRRRNNISEIKLEDGSRLLERKEIENYFMEKFKDLYSFENPHVPKELARLFRKEISDQENVELCKVPTNEEIRKVVWEMHPLKAPGPDGLPALFYKHYWSIVGD